MVPINELSRREDIFDYPISNSSPSNRFIDIDKGKYMVATDLHGHLDDYNQLKLKFNKHKEKGEADKLILLGDYIHCHSNAKYIDSSAIIVSDLIDNSNKPNSDIIALSGNHEHGQIFSMNLGDMNSKEDMVENYKWYSYFFLNNSDNSKYNYNDQINFFKEMPLFVRTKGGVLLTHSIPNFHYFSKIKKQGKKSILDSYKLQEVLGNFDYSNKTVAPIEFYSLFAGNNINKFVEKAKLEMADSPLLESVNNQVSNGLRNVLSSQLKKYFKKISKNSKSKIKTVITGHDPVYYGSLVSAPNHLILSSSYGAPSNKYKKYAIINAEKRYENASILEKECVKPLYL